MPSSKKLTPLTSTGSTRTIVSVSPVPTSLQQYSPRGFHDKKLRDAQHFEQQNFIALQRIQVAEDKAQRRQRQLEHDRNACTLEVVSKADRVIAAKLLAVEAHQRQCSRARSFHHGFVPHQVTAPAFLKAILDDVDVLMARPVQNPTSPKTSKKGSKGSTSPSGSPSSPTIHDSRQTEELPRDNFHFVKRELAFLRLWS